MPDALPFLVLALAGWVNRHQEDRIDYLREEVTPRSGRLALVGAGPGGANRAFFGGVELIVLYVGWTFDFIPVV